MGGWSVMPDRIESIDSRLRDVENAVVEIATIGRMMKVLVAFVGISLGLDVTGIGVAV